MAESVVYASVLGAVMASLPAVSTRLVVFDTNVVDMTDELGDPVELLFGVQLGGGTDIARAVDYCATLVARPNDTAEPPPTGRSSTRLPACARVPGARRCRTCMSGRE